MDKKIIKEDLFENILQGFTDPVIFLSKSFRILWANRAFQVQTNYRIEEIIGNHCYRISHHTETPCDSLLCSCPIIEATRTANTETVTHTHFDKDGNKLFIENTVYPLKNEKGEIIQFICIYRDITERKRTEEEQRETKQLLETILDHTHILVAYLDPEFNFIQVNRAYAAADEREVSFFPGKNHFALYPNEENEEIFQRVVETGKPFYVYAKPFEYAEHPERGLTYWDWSLVPIKDQGKTVRGLVLTLTNVTDRKLMEIALRERIKELNCLYSIADLVKRDTPLEEILQKIAELIPHAWRYPEITCARIILDGQEFKTKNFTDTTWKQSAEIVVHGKPVGAVEVCCLKEKRESDEGPFLKEERSLINAIAERLSRITERIKAEVALQKAHDELEIKVHERTQELMKMNKALLDEIAERKQAEEDLKESREQLRNLYAHLQSAREEERTRIAREIHDEFGTILTALKIDISWLMKKLPGDQNTLIERTKKSIELIDSAIKNVQRISSELRPLILDHLGLAEAIDWQIREFAERTGMHCTHLIDIGGTKLNRDISIAVFRIIQEALTNIARHAKATQISVHVREKDGVLILEVRDDGKGIIHEKLSDPKSLGLISIKERAHSLGGDIKMESERNKGTLLSVMIPLSLKEE